MRVYEEWHQPGKTPSEIISFFRNEGVEDLQIYRIGNRLFMILDLSDKVSAGEFSEAGLVNSDVQAWGNRMAIFQQPLGLSGEAQSLSPSWLAMSRLFNLKDHA
jgi:L-rhamnose mutarotase